MTMTTMTDVFKQFTVELIPESVEHRDIPDSEYYKLPHVSNSKLSLLNPAQGGNPAKFLEGFKSNNSNALTLGLLVHNPILSKDEYVVSDIYAPSSKLGKACAEFIELRKLNTPIEEALILACEKAEYYVGKLLNSRATGLPDFIKKAMRECWPYYKAQKTKTIDGKTVMFGTKDQIETSKRCVENLLGNPEIAEHLNHKNSTTEGAILCDFRVTFPRDFDDENSERVEQIVKFKMKYDHVWFDAVNKRYALNDIKTTGTHVNYFWGYEEYDPFKNQVVSKPGSMQKFHYKRQMALYLYLLKAFVDKHHGEGYIPYANMLVVETVGLNKSRLYKLNNEDIKQGWYEGLEMLKRVAYLQEYGPEKSIEAVLTNAYDDFGL